MTWDEHLAELNSIRALCQQRRPLLGEVWQEMILEWLDALEVDRWCRGEDPYGFLRLIVTEMSDNEPNLTEYNSDGYPATVREATKKLRAYEPTSWQITRLLGYASWIQIHGWQAIEPRLAEQLRSEYDHAGVDPKAIDFSAN